MRWWRRTMMKKKTKVSDQSDDVVRFVASTSWSEQAEAGPEVETEAATKQRGTTELPPAANARGHPQMSPRP